LAFVVEAGDDADAATLRARGCQRHPGERRMTEAREAEREQPPGEEG